MVCVIFLGSSILQFLFPRRFSLTYDQINTLQQQINEVKEEQEWSKGEIAKIKQFQHEYIADLQQRLAKIRGSEIKSSFSNRLFEAVVEQDDGKIEALEEEMKTFTFLSKETQEAWLDLLDYEKKLVRFNKDTLLTSGDIFKAAEAWEEALRLKISEKEQVLRKEQEGNLIIIAVEISLMVLAFVGIRKWKVLRKEKAKGPDKMI